MRVAILMLDEGAKADSRRVVNSFVVRFVHLTEQEAAASADMIEIEPQHAWRGVVQHIQSGTELHFNRIEQVKAFMLKHLSNEQQATSGEL
jgi:hypothetical protein